MKIVITGHSKSGKSILCRALEREFTAKIVAVPNVIEMMKCIHFPNLHTEQSQKSYQRALYYLQRELEESMTEKTNNKLMICDHGTVDCLAQWPGSAESFFSEVESSLGKELARYDWVIQIDERPRKISGLDPQNFWSFHPHLIKIPYSKKFSKCMSSTAKIISAILDGSSYQKITGILEKDLALGPEEPPFLYP